MLSSCASRPDGVLSNRQMTEVLVELHHAEGVLQVAGYNYGHDEDVKAYFSVILAQHGITQAQFDSSLVWYTDHPQYFQRVYPKVLKRLQQQHDEETARLTAFDEALKQALADSLATAQAAEGSALRFFLNRLPEGSIIMPDGSFRLSADAMERSYVRGCVQPLFVLEQPVPLCTDSLLLPTNQE